MAESNHLCDLWQQTIVKVFKHDSKSQLGLMLKEWIKCIKLDNFNSILNYTIDDFTPSGSLSYMSEHGQILHDTPLREVFNIRCYIQHLMDGSENETENPLSQQNWMKHTNWKFIKHVIHYSHSMTLEQNSSRNLSKKFSRNNMKNLIKRKGSQMKRKRNPPHLQKPQNKTLSLTHLLKTKKSQIN